MDYEEIEYLILQAEEERISQNIIYDDDI